MLSRLGFRIPPVSQNRRRGKSRAVRPKPPRDENAEHVLRLCREGRLFELQAWVEQGKSLAVPNGFRRSPLRAALDTGFHSLIEFLLTQEADQSNRDLVLQEACWRNQPSVMRLALQYGASVAAVPFQQLLETGNRDAVKLFLERGADPVTGAPFARAFKGRIKVTLGMFLDCQRMRPELAHSLQQQADMALRQACWDDDLKWVSLLMWLGADPRSKGPATDELDDQASQNSPEDHESALQIACQSRKPEILRCLKPSPEKDDLRELMAAAARWSTTPETVAYLVGMGASINDKADGSSSALDTCLRHFGLKELTWDPSNPYRRELVPISRLDKSFNAFSFLLERGARWSPDQRAIVDARRALYQLEGEAAVTVVDLLRAHLACDEETLKTLTRAPKMRQILLAVERQRAERRGKARPVSKNAKDPQRAKSAWTWSVLNFRYDRQRLYDEVWAEPTRLVAQRYNVSDVAIGKVCSHLGIPKPPRGCWAKKAAGHKVPIRPPLPVIGK
jgi:hypothetical protein